MKLLFIIFTLIALPLLAACSMTLPLQGDLNNGREPFLGSATGYTDGTGTLAMTTQDGIACTGKFKYDRTRVTGNGIFDCVDGRTGKFQFTSTGRSGHGFGKTTDGTPFKFTFGAEDTVRIL